MDSKILRPWASKQSLEDASLDFEEGSVLIEKQKVEVDAPVDEMASRQRIEWEKEKLRALGFHLLVDELVAEERETYDTMSSRPAVSLPLSRRPERRLASPRPPSESLGNREVSAGTALVDSTSIGRSGRSSEYPVREAEDSGQVRSIYQSTTIQDRGVSSEYQTPDLEGRLLGSQPRMLDAARSLRGSDYPTLDTSRRIHRSQVQCSEASLTHGDRQAPESSMRFAGEPVKPYEVNVMEFELISHLFHTVETSLLFCSIEANIYRSDFWERLSSQNGSDGVGHASSPSAWFNVENDRLPVGELVQWIEDHKAKLCLAVRDLFGRRWLNYLDNREALFVRKIALGEAYLERGDYRWLCLAALALSRGFKQLAPPISLFEVHQISARICQIIWIRVIPQLFYSDLLNISE